MRVLALLFIIGLLLIFEITPAVKANSQLSVIVTTGESNYPSGNMVLIYGMLLDSQGNPVASGSISIQVVSSEGQSIHIALVYTESDGQFYDEFLLVEDSPEGSYIVYVTASKSGYENVNTNITFLVGKLGSTSDFIISVSPPSQTFSSGENITFHIITSPINGFNNSVSLEVNGLPNGTSANFNPSSIVPPLSSTLSIQTSPSTPYGTYTLTIVGTGGGLTQSTNANISSSASTGGGCLIATATYGSELSPEVNFLRSFRDNSIVSTYVGKQFIEVFNKFYYSFSPTIAYIISENPFIRNIAKFTLYPLIASLHLAADVYGLLIFNKEIGVVVAGLVASFMIGTTYILPLYCLWLILTRFYYKRMILKEQALNILKFLGFIWASTFILLTLGEILFSSYLISFASSVMVITTVFMPSAITFLLASKVRDV